MFSLTDLIPFSTDSSRSSRAMRDLSMMLVTLSVLLRGEFGSPVAFWDCDLCRSS